MDKTIIKKIQKHILELDSFGFDEDIELIINTTSFKSDEEKQEAIDNIYDSFFGLDFGGGQILILNECSVGMDVDRTFYLYDAHRDILKLAKDEYDELYREFDDNHPIRENPHVFDIISKRHDNNIDYMDAEWEPLYFEDGEIHPDFDGKKEYFETIFDIEDVKEVCNKQELLEYDFSLLFEEIDKLKESLIEATKKPNIEWKVDKDGDIYFRKKE